MQIEQLPARATLHQEEGVLRVELAGVWRITAPRPSWSDLAGGDVPGLVRVDMQGVTWWDSSLLLFLFEIREWCFASHVHWDADTLPAKVRALLDEFTAPGTPPPDILPPPRLVARIGLATHALATEGRDFIQVVGGSVLGLSRLVRGKGGFRWGDCLSEMQQCGAQALPIVGLISFLIGVTLAYTGAVILRQFGGDIWVADLVGLSMVREMGAMMTGIIMAGRTGAAFAATIGNMKMNEEVDALETLGVSAVDFLVLPRLLALGLMMPLLVLYANTLGILGGGVVALAILDIPPTAYWVELLTAVDLSDVAVGLVKGSTFGIIVGIAGCVCGLRAERSAAGVGKAATSAVVSAILLLIVVDSLYAVIFEILGF